MRSSIARSVRQLVLPIRYRKIRFGYGGLSNGTVLNNPGQRDLE